MKILVSFDTTLSNCPNTLVLHPQQLNNLNDFCDNCECTEFILDNVLQCVPFSQITGLLNMVIGKLRHGGKLVINFVETIEVFKSFLNGQLSLNDLNNLVFGSNVRHVSIVCLPTVREVLENNNLEICMMQLNQFNATIVAERQ